jgi:hypothetical protein
MKFISAARKAGDEEIFALKESSDSKAMESNDFQPAAAAAEHKAGGRLANSLAATGAEATTPPRTGKMGDKRSRHDGLELTVGSEALLLLLSSGRNFILTN